MADLTIAELMETRVDVGENLMMEEDGLLGLDDDTLCATHDEIEPVPSRLPLACSRPLTGDSIVVSISSTLPTALMLYEIEIIIDSGQYIAMSLHK